MTTAEGEDVTELSTEVQIHEIEKIKELVRSIDVRWRHHLHDLRDQTSYNGYKRVVVPFFDDWTEMITPLRSFVDQRETALRAQLAEEQAAAPPPAQDPPPSN